MWLSKLEQLPKLQKSLTRGNLWRVQYHPILEIRHLGAGTSAVIFQKVSCARPNAITCC